MDFDKRPDQIGVRPEIRQKEPEILNIFNPQNEVTDCHIDDNTIEGQSQLPGTGGFPRQEMSSISTNRNILLPNWNQSRLDRVQPPMDFLGPWMLAAVKAGHTRYMTPILDHV